MLPALSVVALAGDGIGPEILDVALAVLGSAAAAADMRLDVRKFAAGATVAARHGAPVTADALDACRQTRIILKSPTGEPSQRSAEGTEIGMASGYLRQRLGLWANVRPARRLPSVPAFAVRPIDCVVVRENSEGVYASRGRTVRAGETAVDTVLVTRGATERIARLAFRLARARAAASGRQALVTCVDKANVLGTYAFFRAVTAGVAREFPDVRFQAMHADAAAAALVQRPDAFDVIVTENLLGDILSDEAGAVAGGIGLCPSANLGDGIAMFEPIHGSAPDLVGTDRANSIGQVLSAAMLLQWAGARAAGLWIEDAVHDALAAGALHVESDGTLREGAGAAARILPEFVQEASRRAPCGRPPLLPISQTDT